MLSLLVGTAVMKKITMTNMRKITKESMKGKIITMSTVKNVFTLKLNLRH
jgi:hypothetical protein